ncbi:MAG: GGDEF domain-containing protein, partial [Gordonia sp. (in: high G+C Gram-positive bacteria)]|uniref:GGDEF domain-containing protein n=1 Tax=Gordonia sp. (in: high G+C Gram-positive bacteria) TaxID=84139 RepID=UPI003BB7F457
MFGSAHESGTTSPVGRASWRQLRLPGFPRFEPEEERAFRAEFVAAGRRHKFELWLLLLVITAILVVFHRYYFTDPGTPRMVLPLLVVALVIPAVLRWLSSSYRPWLRWSTALFVISVYLDVACLMAIRAISIAGGHDLVPILLPVGVLAALLVVNVRFLILLPTVLIGFAGLAVIELLTIPTDSNQLFNVVASGAILLVPLLSTYELERLNRVAWQQKQELARHSVTDALTGLPNRRAFAESVRTDLADRADRSTPIALALIDLDCFKHLNDTLGHPAGDRALTAIGHYLLDDSAAHGSPGELLARLSGEEFAVYWPDLDAASAHRRAEALRAGIGELALPMPLTASAGFVSRTPAHHNPAHDNPAHDDPEIAIR